MPSDDGTPVTEEPESAEFLRRAAQNIHNASECMEEAIDRAEVGTTAGVTAGYRAEANGLATRLRQYADVIDPHGDDGGGE